MGYPAILKRSERLKRKANFYRTPMIRSNAEAISMWTWTCTRKCKWRMSVNNNCANVKSHMIDNSKGHSSRRVKARYNRTRFVLTITATASNTSSIKSKHLQAVVCVAASPATMWVNTTKMAGWLWSQDSAKLERRSLPNLCKSWYQKGMNRSTRKRWTIWSTTSINPRIKPSPKTKTRRKTRRRRAKAVGSVRRPPKLEE